MEWGAHAFNLSWHRFSTSSSLYTILQSRKSAAGGRTGRRRRSPLYVQCLGWVGVGWRRRRKTRLLLREVGNQRTFFLFVFWAAHHGGRVVDQFCAGGTSTPHKQGGEGMTQCVYGEAPTGAVTYVTHCCLWKWPHQNVNQFMDAVSTGRDGEVQRERYSLRDGAVRVHGLRI